VDEPVHDRVSDGGVLDDAVPSGNGELAGDERGPLLTPVLDHFEKVVSGDGVEDGQAPIVEDEELDAFQGLHELVVGSVASGDGEVVETAM